MLQLCACSSQRGMAHIQLDKINTVQRKPCEATKHAGIGIKKDMHVVGKL